ncbi:uncharacterized protein LOC109798597 [Cajanus cajan]|nr:uncharacterized protein LOC109798597 [Cajanus cajan]
MQSGRGGVLNHVVAAALTGVPEVLDRCCVKSHSNPISREGLIGLRKGFQALYLQMSTISLRSILADEKLVGSNFDDWYRTLRIVLMHEKLIDVIDKPVVPQPANGDEQATNAYKKYLEDYMSTKCLLLASMSSELQRQHEDMDPVDIINHLKKMYGGQSRTARFQLSKTLFRSTLTANAEVGPHVLKMISLIEQLEKSGCKLGKELSQDLILQSLPGTFS